MASTSQRSKLPSINSVIRITIEVFFMGTGLFKVYRSSAGSGKTYTLVREYLRLCLQNKRPDYFGRILAITFTNKAAEEMKDRVLSKLRGFTEGPKSSSYDCAMAEDLCRSTGLDSRTLSERCREILECMLHSYGQLGISTIDKFIHGVIRSFSRDLHLAADFEVEIDTKALLERVVDEMLSRVGMDNDLSQLLLEYIRHRVEEEEKHTIRNELANLAMELEKEGAADALLQIAALKSEDFTGIFSDLLSDIRDFESELFKRIRKLRDFFAAHDLQKHHFKSGTLFTWVMDEKIFLKKEISKTILTTLETGEFYAKSNFGVAEKSALDALAPELLSLLREVMQFYQDGFGDYVIRREVRKQHYPMATLRYIRQVLDEIKQREGILPISEFNRMVSGIIANSPAPFIFERIGERYHHYLIDEFQDTSVLQWQNFIPLVENGLASGHFSLIVGDGKQAIYRWRNGEVEQFAALPGIFRSEGKPVLKEKERILVENYGEESLKDNWRSGKTIVEFNNAIFRSISQTLHSEGLRKIYEGHEQNVRSSREGRVEVHFIESTGEERDMERGYKILEMVKKCCAEGFEFRDVAVLCRTRAQCKQVASLLMGEGIPVITTDSLSIVGDSQVLLILSLLKLREDPSDVGAALELIACWHHIRGDQDRVFESISRYRLFRKNRSGQGRTALDAEAFLKELGLAELLEQRPQEGLYGLAERLIAICGFDAAKNSYLEFFLEHIYQFSLRINDAGAFLRWWEEKGDKAEIRISQALNAVKVMTIHKSKGLEFQVVVVPFPEVAKKGPSNVLWLPLEGLAGPLETGIFRHSEKKFAGTRLAGAIEEETDRIDLDRMNEFYVACTRAVERLYLITTGKYPPGSWLMAALSEMGVGTPNPETPVCLGVEEAPAPRSGQTESSRMNYLPSERRRPQGLRMSLEAPWDWDVRFPFGKRDKGTIYHEILARVRVAEDLDAAIDQIASDFRFPATQKEFMHKVLSGFLAVPEVRAWFIPGLDLRIEQSYLNSEGLMLRPDRIIVGEQEVAIVDFKTGYPHPGHLDQVRRYGEVLEQIYARPVSAALAYIETGEIHRL